MHMEIDVFFVGEKDLVRLLIVMHITNIHYNKNGNLQ